MATWEVLKLSNKHDLNEGFIYVGDHETDHSWSLSYETPQQIGDKYGAGEYLLLNDENQRFERLSIGVRNEYYEITDPEPTVPVEGKLRLSATAQVVGEYPTVAEVMEREG